ncbi:MAG: hypothetical protein IJH63_00840 [Methanobrevibacter sp.]|nr:hypothetical protein [Methanosphaera sp.]MBR0369251.1 hypothetical protein [Methanobrevibacter sp.]
MLINICGNCETYNYDSQRPAQDGGCKKVNGTLSPLAEPCNEFKPKKK